MLRRLMTSFLMFVFLVGSTGCIEEPVKPESNDWSTIWISNTNVDDLPRILLVGDSITNGYYDSVEEQLNNRAYLGRYTTSKFISNPDLRAELQIIIQRYDFEIIHINNGLHGWDYSLEEYQKGIENLLKLLDRDAPDTTIIWVLTTPIRMEADLTYLDRINQRVIDRNQIATEIMVSEGIVINDLYSAMIEHPEYYRSDGLHFNDQGKSVQADLVAEILLKHLTE